MPQCSQKRKGGELVADSKGNVAGALCQLALTTKKRADRLNEGEHVKLLLHAARLDRSLRLLQHHQDNVMSRVSRTRNEMLAYQTVVNREFRAEHFHTLQLGYNERAARKDPVEMTRLNMETKLYHSGFNKHVLKKKIATQVKALIPENQQREMRQKRIEMLKEKNAPFIVDRRTRSLTIIFKSFSQHKNIHQQSMKDVLEDKRAQKPPRLDGHTMEQVINAISENNKAGNGSDEGEQKGDVSYSRKETQRPQLHGQETQLPQLQGQETQRPQLHGQETQRPQLQGQETQRPQLQRQETQRPKSQQLDSQRPPFERANTFRPQSQQLQRSQLDIDVQRHTATEHEREED